MIETSLEMGQRNGTEGKNFYLKNLVNAGGITRVSQEIFAATHLKPKPVVFLKLRPLHSWDVILDISDGELI